MALKKCMELVMILHFLPETPTLHQNHKNVHMYCIFPSVNCDPLRGCETSLMDCDQYSFVNNNNFTKNASHVYYFMKLLFQFYIW